MALPIVIVSSGGLAVTESTNTFGIPVEIAANGFGIPVTVVSSGGLQVVGSGGGGSSNTLQSDTGVDILADTGQPILVQ